MQKLVKNYSSLLLGHIFFPAWQPAFVIPYHISLVIFFFFHSTDHLVLSNFSSYLELNIEINIIHVHDMKSVVFQWFSIHRVGIGFYNLFSLNFAWHDRFYENWADHLIIQLGLLSLIFLFLSSVAFAYVRRYTLLIPNCGDRFQTYKIPLSNYNGF